MLQKCVLPETDGSKQEENVQFGFKETVIHRTSVIKYEVLWASEFLGRKFERADQTPHKICTPFLKVQIPFVRYDVSGTLEPCALILLILSASRSNLSCCLFTSICVWSFSGLTANDSIQIHVI